MSVHRSNSLLQHLCRMDTVTFWVFRRTCRPRGHSWDSRLRYPLACSGFFLLLSRSVQRQQSLVFAVGVAGSQTFTSLCSLSRPVNPTASRFLSVAEAAQISGCTCLNCEHCLRFLEPLALRGNSVIYAGCTSKSSPSGRARRRL